MSFVFDKWDKNGDRFDHFIPLERSDSSGIQVAEEADRLPILVAHVYGNLGANEAGYCFAKISGIMDHKGQLILTWNLLPTEKRKRRFLWHGRVACVANVPRT